MSRRIVTLRPGVELVQEEPWFPLGQDTLLLARFAAERARGRGLDLGCGQGFLAILTALRRPGLTLEGLECFPGAAALAAENARRDFSAEGFARHAAQVYAAAIEGESLCQSA